MDNRPFPPPPYDRAGKQSPTTNWALSVVEEWGDRGYPELEGSPCEQLKLARALLGLSQPWQGDLPPELRDP